ncbi:hypothetical protein [Streptomyces microflavus]|uniref:Ricin-type beta-trefoil lectin domain-containing protein n=1 Tax=Streptomyces microflavus TaxID=1919 RepID=A0ABV1QFP1_STRMI
MIRTVKHATVAALLALGVAAPSATATTTPAAPAAEQGPVTLRPQVQPRTCLDGNANKLLWACNGNGFQNWTVKDSNDDGRFALIYQRAGTCLTTNIKSEAFLSRCFSDVISEDWIKTEVPGGYQLQDDFTKKCLGVDTKYIWGEDVPVKLRTFDCVRNKWQTWLIG